MGVPPPLETSVPTRVDQTSFFSGWEHGEEGWSRFLSLSTSLCLPQYLLWLPASDWVISRGQNKAPLRLWHRSLGIPNHSLCPGSGALPRCRERQQTYTLLLQLPNRYVSKSASLGTGGKKVKASSCFWVHLMAVQIWRPPPFWIRVISLITVLPDARPSTHLCSLLPLVLCSLSCLSLPRNPHLGLGI